MTFKNKCWIVSSLLQKAHDVLPVQFLWTRLSLIRITPLFKYHKNVLILRGNLSFQMSLLCQILPMVMSLYIVRTLKIPFSLSPHLNTSSLSFSLTWAILDTRLYQEWRLSLVKHLLKDMFRRTDVNIKATISCLCLPILYRCGYCCFSELLPVYISFQNLIFAPLLS
jgi:hypothetical protein